jgi:hypothetical protein
VYLGRPHLVRGHYSAKEKTSGKIFDSRQGRGTGALSTGALSTGSRCCNDGGLAGVLAGVDGRGSVTVVLSRRRN